MLDASIALHLTQDDDPLLWEIVVNTVLADTVEAIAATPKEIFVRVGCCGHWISPHHPLRWLAGGGFAWPFGYDKTVTGWSYRAVPELEWSECFVWTGENWKPGQAGSRALVRRVAIPARTARHLQAAVHTIWTPRSPSGEEKQVPAYGFRKHLDVWSLTAHETFQPRTRRRFRKKSHRPTES
jgi:hypothetical protein